ncbi:hypothetical protein T08_15437, partial [Trichinella sp. T8]
LNVKVKKFNQARVNGVCGVSVKVALITGFRITPV